MRRIIPVAVLMLGFCGKVVAQNTFPSTGPAGIGTTSPAKDLHVLSSSDATILVESPSSSANLSLKSNNQTWMWSKRTANENNALSLFYHNGTSFVYPQYLNVLTSGNVGIGVEMPLAKLHVGGKSMIETNDDDVLTFNNTDNAWQYISYKRSGVRQVWMGLDGLSDFYFTKETPGHFVFAPSNGNVAIGQLTPSEKLTVGGNIFLQASQPSFQMSDRFTAQVPATGDNGWTRSLVSQNIKWNHTTSKWRVDAGEYSDFAMMRFENNGFIGFYTRAVQPASYEMTDAESYDYRRMFIDNLGNVGIGILPNDNTKGYKLAVNGSAIFTSAKVKLYGNWPDYVFHKSYTLPSLQEVEAYIKQHNHLPDMPSAEEVSKEGIDLGNNQVLLLKKVEELTMYIIEQDKMLKKQQAEIEELKKKSEK